MKLQVFDKNLINYTHKLSSLKGSVLPIAVRFTLSDLAADVKKKTLMQSAEKEFNVRRSGFFKGNSAYIKAKGFDIKSMRSTVGMTEGKSPNSNAIEGLGIQQTGGTIGRKKYIPTEESKTSRGLVKSAYKRDMNGKGLISIGRVSKGMFIRAVFGAQKSGKNIKVTGKKTSYIISVKSAEKTEGGELKYKLKYLQTINKSGVAKIDKKRPFLTNAAKNSHGKVGEIYIKNAEKQLSKWK